MAAVASSRCSRCGSIRFARGRSGSDGFKECLKPKALSPKTLKPKTDTHTHTETESLESLGVLGLRSS